jgi:hypothetical protein
LAQISQALVLTQKATVGPSVSVDAATESLTTAVAILKQLPGDVRSDDKPKEYSRALFTLS